jgi:hypothetical protein
VYARLARYYWGFLEFFLLPRLKKITDRIWSSLQMYGIASSTYNFIFFHNDPPVFAFGNDDCKFWRQVSEMLKDPFGRKKRLCLRRTLTAPW